MKHSLLLLFFAPILGLAEAGINLLEEKIVHVVVKNKPWALLLLWQVVNTNSGIMSFTCVGHRNTLSGSHVGAI